MKVEIDFEDFRAFVHGHDYVVKGAKGIVEVMLPDGETVLKGKLIH
jgi:hypothetical protein